MATAEIAAQCACLPLALAVAAARAADRPRLPLSALAAELRDTASRLDALDAADPAASVRAVFSWSYDQLPADAALLFRLLGLHPGPDLSVPAAASLAAADQPATRRLLHALARAHLVTEHAPNRYTLHDLLRAYSIDLARGDAGEVRRAATDRLLDHYLHTAHAGALVIEPTEVPLSLDPPVPGVAAEQISGYWEAMAWFEAEFQVLLAAIALAAGLPDRRGWQIPWTMTHFLSRSASIRDWVGLTGSRGRARTLCLQALSLIEETSHPSMEGMIWGNLGYLADKQRDFAEAARCYERAASTFWALGFVGPEVMSLCALAEARHAAGDEPRAREAWQRALVFLDLHDHKTAAEIRAKLTRPLS